MDMQNINKEAVENNDQIVKARFLGPKSENREYFEKTAL